MIWNDSILAGTSNLETLTRHIAAEIRSAGVDSPAESVTFDDKELARSVAEFISRNTPEFAATNKGAVIPSDYLLIMTCRALWAVGHAPEAETLLRTKGPELNIDESYAKAIFAETLPPGLEMHAAFVRALRPSSSFWDRNGPCWILDLRVIFSFLDTGLELTIWRVLHAFMKQLVVLWEASSGQGTLGIKNARYVSAHILGLPRKSRPARKFIQEMAHYCEQDLKAAALERQWRFTPAIMDIGP